MIVRVMTRPGNILRKPGPKRVRLTDTDEQTMAGLSGTPEKVAQRSPADYFGDQPEEVELTSWVERMIRRGALIVAPSSEPKSSKPLARGDKPVPLTE